jgi:hypothetical protein
VHWLDLGAQVVWHGAAGGFVGGVPLVAEGRAFGVEDADSVVGRLLFAQRLHHVDNAANRPRGWAGGVASHGTQVGHGMKSAVKIAGAIYQKKGFSHCLPFCRDYPPVYFYRIKLIYIIAFIHAKILLTKEIAYVYQFDK